MDNLYFISREGKRAPVNLGINIDPFNRVDELCSSVWYSGINGIGWLTGEGGEVEFIVPDSSLYAYPTPDMSKVVVIYSDDEIKEPNNAVILNADGSRYRQLIMPKRLSIPEGRRLPRGGLTGFMQCGWFDDLNYMSFECYIADSDFIERRLLRMSDFKFDDKYFHTWRL